MGPTVTAGALPRPRWEPIVAGVLCALALHILLGLFGTALGFAAEAADSRALGALAAIWAVITPLAATFVGAMVAVRMSGIGATPEALLNGALVWCIGLIVGAIFLSGTLAGGVALGPVEPSLRGEIVENEVANRSATGTGLAAIAALAGLGGGLLGGLAGRGALTGESLPGRARDRVASDPMRSLEREHATDRERASERERGTLRQPIGEREREIERGRAERTRDRVEPYAEATHPLRTSDVEADPWARDATERPWGDNRRTGMPDRRRH
jgi:hypothetical protein